MNPNNKCVNIECKNAATKKITLDPTKNPTVPWTRLCDKHFYNYIQDFNDLWESVEPYTPAPEIPKEIQEFGKTEYLPATFELVDTVTSTGTVTYTINVTPAAVQDLTVTLNCDGGIIWSWSEP